MAKIDIKALKSEAEKFRGKGKLEKAIALYEQIWDAKGADAKTLQKMAEIYLKLGFKEEGVEAYREAMKGYLETGFLVQAIAVGKILQELMPDNKEINQEVEELLAKKRGPAVAAPHLAPSAKAPPPPPKPVPEEAKAAPASPEPAPESKEEWMESTAQEAAAQAEAKETPKAETEAPAPEPGAIAVEPEVSAEPEVEVEEKSSMDLTLFAGLDEKEFSELYKKLRSVKIPGGIRVCREEEEGDSIFILASGEVEVTKKDPEGNERLVARLGPGQFFGEFAYFTGGKRQATVKAIGDLELLEISKDQMDEIVEKYPQVKEVMLNLYKERVLDNLLALSPLTAILPPEDRRKLIEKFELKEAEPGETVVKEGDPGDSMFLIKSGKVEVTTIDPKDKRRLTLARLGSGDFFGEVSLLKNKPRTATITALTPSELMILKRSAFETLSSNHPEMMALIEQTIERRVEATIKKIMGEK